MPSSSAFADAPSRIFTKNGLVSVFVIRQALTEWFAAMAEPVIAMAPSMVAPNKDVLMVTFVPPVSYPQGHSPGGLLARWRFADRHHVSRRKHDSQQSVNK